MDFEDFGSAAQPTIPATRLQGRVRRDACTPSGFDLEIEDDLVLKAEQATRSRRPSRRSAGTSTGYFDFDLERGQGAQTFP